MKKVALTLACFLIYSLVRSQETGIQFERSLDWKQILAKAKKEQKFIFIDCYATWCGPCKYMSQNIFPLKAIGEAVNLKFISLSIQLDSTAHDSDTVKRWYNDAHYISETYNIQTYPTYLFFDFNGNPVHRAVGAIDSAGFVLLTQNAMDPGKQYYSLIRQFHQANTDTSFLQSLGQQAISNGDQNLADSVFVIWFSKIRDPLAKNNLGIISQITNKSTDPGFDLFFRNASKIDQIVRPDFSEIALMNIMIRENSMIMAMFKTNSAVPDWEKIEDDLASKYGTVYGRRTITWIKVPYYKKEKNWDLYGTSVIAYIKNYGNYLQPLELNNYAWDIFQHCNSSDALTFGLDCINRSIKALTTPDASIIDTYANLLYKLGQKDEAIAQESKALELASTPEKTSFQTTLDKMKSGQNTW